ncbi:MAG: 16S rRNA (guanine(527)-N(7))-methyltransferase RsmG [Clostridia bacterium]|nr:16S rRNA (guanine(527)-N(7))-methyltransferase RsmG [Clostridia bacterium]
MPLEERHIALIRAAAPYAAIDPEKFSALYDRLVDLNSKINVTSVTDPAGASLRHFADSLSLIKTGLFEKATLCLDVGCGGGFPGLPLALALPGLSVTMLDATKKKTDALKETCELLGISNVAPLCGRAEELSLPGGAQRERYPLVFSRALARLDVLCELCLPFVSVGGHFIAMKGRDFKEELKEAKSAIALLGGETVRIEDVSLSPGVFDRIPIDEAERAEANDFASSGRALVVIKKRRPTPAAYPRAFAKIKKKPL